MGNCIFKDALMAEIERRLEEYRAYPDYQIDSNYRELCDILSFINTLEVKDPHEQCNDSIKAHAETYSFNIESELFHQLTKEQQALWRKEIEQACISGGEVGAELARDPRYKENHDKETDKVQEIIKEKAKRYDKAIEATRRLVDIGLVYEDAAIQIFPELKESEGERIRKEIISALKYANHKGIYDKHIAWLEKQNKQEPIDPNQQRLDAPADAEQKPTDKVEQESIWTDDDEEMVQVAIDACNSYQESLLSDSRFDKVVKAGDWLKSLKDRAQFKRDWSEKDEEIHKKCICAMRASACGFPEEEKFVEQVDNWFKSLKDKIQPQIKQEWNEEDEDMLYKATAVINRLCAEGKEYVWSIKTLKKLFYWLKSLKNRIQPKAEWNEEDKNIICFLIDITENYKIRNGFSSVLEQGDKAIDWLKSLRPQNKWKPSDEQMRFLQKCIKAYNEVTFPTEVRVLSSLYNDLKKL